MPIYAYREKADRESRAQLQASGKQMNTEHKGCAGDHILYHRLGNNSLS